MLSVATQRSTLASCSRMRLGPIPRAFHSQALLSSTAETQPPNTHLRNETEAEGLENVRLSQGVSVPSRSFARPVDGLERFTGKRKEVGVESPPLDPCLVPLLASCVRNTQKGETYAEKLGLLREQESLVAILRRLRYSAMRQKIDLSPAQYVQLHDHLIRRSKDGTCNKPIWMEGLGGRKYSIVFPHCVRSVQSYVALLKYAARYDDFPLVERIGRAALDFHELRKTTPGKAMYSVENQRNGLLKERTHLRRLIRNLLLSVSRRLGRPVRPIAEAGRALNGIGVSLPSPNHVVRRDDDLFALRHIARLPVGILRNEQDESGEGQIRLSRKASSSHYPLYKVSRKIKGVNLLAQRRKLALTVRLPGGRVGEGHYDDPEADKVDFTPSSKLLRLFETIVPKQLDMHLEESRNSGAQASNSVECQRKNPDLYLGTLRHWRRSVRHQAEERKKAIALLKMGQGNSDFAFARGNSSPRLSPSSSEPIVPTWLLLDTLNSAVESGYPRQAAYIVNLYLRCIQERYNATTADMLTIFPYSSAIYAVTSPEEPPNSPSLLNAILRGYLMSTATDPWVHMLNVIDRWCYDGEGFANAVREACGLPTVEESNASKLPASYRLRSDTPCLLPNESTIILLLDALPPALPKGNGRARRVAYGHATVQEMWNRWSSTDGATWAGRLNESPVERPLKLTIRTFRKLLRLSLDASSSKGVHETLSMHDEWMSETKKARFTSKSALQAHYGSDFVVARRERMRWTEALARTVEKGFLTQNEAQRHLSRWDYESPSILPR